MIRFVRLVGQFVVVLAFAALCVLAGRCFGKVMYRATGLVPQHAQEPDAQ